MQDFSDEQLAKLIMQTVPLIARTLDASLRQLNQNLSPTHFGLLMMLTQGPAVSQSDLAERLHISPSTLSATVEALVRRDWIKRKPSSQDRRVILIEITPGGRAVLEQSHHQVLEVLMKVIATVSESDRDDINIGLRALQRAFIEEWAKTPGDAKMNFPMPPEGLPFPPPFDLPFPK